MSNAIHTVRILGTFSTGHVLAEYTPAQGALAGQKRVGFLTKGGKACKSIPAHAEPVTPESPTPSPTVVVAAEVTAEPAQSKTVSRKRKGKARKSSRNRPGMTWHSFMGECRKVGLTMSDASFLWNNGAKGKPGAVQDKIILKWAAPYEPLDLPSTPIADTEYTFMYEHDGNEVEVECLDTDKDGNTLPYQPESERGNPQPLYGNAEIECPSDEVIAEQAHNLREDTQAFLRGIQARLA
jgi:hypothetical protein